MAGLMAVKYVTSERTGVVKSKQSAFVRRNRRNQLKPLLGFAGGVAGAVLARVLGFPDWVSVAFFASRSSARWLMSSS
jgi:hypothetical protein